MNSNNKRATTNVIALFYFLNCKNYFGSGAPTATSHLCPGWPCGGFIPGAVTPAGAVACGCICGCAWIGDGAGVGFCGAAFLLGAEFNGAPTAISHL